MRDRPALPSPVLDFALMPGLERGRDAGLRSGPAISEAPPKRRELPAWSGGSQRVTGARVQKIPKFAFLLPLALVLHPPPLAAQQSDSLIEREINEAREASYWQFGPVWLTPQFSLLGLYDTNPILTPLPHESDVGGAATPALHASISPGARVLFDFTDRVTFQYYRENTKLRRVLNNAQSGIAIGGKDVLAKANGELHTKLTSPTSEFDVLVEQRTTQAGSSLDLALGNRQKLTLGYLYRRILITDDNVGVVPILRASRLNRREQSLSLRIARHVTPRAIAVAEGTLQYIDFDEPRKIGNARSVEGVGGLEFSPTGPIRGRAVLGYKRVEGELSSEADFAGLTGSIDTSLRLGSRTEVRGVYKRDAGPSALGTARFFTEESYGGFVEVSLAERMSVRSGAVFGTISNRVPARFIDVNGQEVEKPLAADRHQYYFTVTRRLTVPWVVALDAEYLSRTSDAALFNKNRLKIALSLSSQF